jgi:hypothetical protein
MRAELPGAAVVAYGLAEYRDVHEVRAFFETNCELPLILSILT